MPFDGVGPYRWEDQPELAPASQSYVVTAILALLLGVLPLLVIVVIDTRRYIYGS